MYIENENASTRYLYDAEVMADEYSPPGIAFGQNNAARVTQEVGEALAEKYDGITVREEEDEEPDEEELDVVELEDTDEE